MNSKERQELMNRASRFCESTKNVAIDDDDTRRLVNRLRELCEEMIAELDFCQGRMSRVCTGELLHNQN